MWLSFRVVEMSTAGDNRKNEQPLLTSVLSDRNAGSLHSRIVELCKEQRDYSLPKRHYQWIAHLCTLLPALQLSLG